MEYTATPELQPIVPAFRVRILDEEQLNQLRSATLEISPATAKAHVSNILSKLGASSRAEAVSVAIQENLVS